jgi:hypothetical protein
MSECFEAAAGDSRMEDFSTKLANATDTASRDLLGAIALVVNNDGKVNLDPADVMSTADHVKAYNTTMHRDTKI